MKRSRGNGERLLRGNLMKRMKASDVTEPGWYWAWLPCCCNDDSQWEIVEYKNEYDIDRSGTEIPMSQVEFGDAWFIGPLDIPPPP